MSSYDAIDEALMTCSPSIGLGDGLFDVDCTYVLGRLDIGRTGGALWVYVVGWVFYSEVGMWLVG